MVVNEFQKVLRHSKIPILIQDYYSRHFQETVAHRIKNNQEKPMHAKRALEWTAFDESKRSGNPRKTWHSNLLEL